ncbi:DNA cytosine methyltransferase [Sedimenticola thiotaurini]|uniref:Cytosine-specific methyltransferase n=1 Tax=Sedimenticola thiotaurini TaxID=1543721 RepID=A0A0F7K4C8_9GAMM|nr:DNA cytosine methyltransferase [Sedimenticola thiotaurini]AKH22414.1 DNA methyltransferase [Sedimenticola thiotaurini]
MDKNHNQPTAIDLFCGAGGLSEGFQQAGFKILAGNDMDVFAGETFQRTHPNAVFIPGPINRVTAPRLLRETGLKKGDLDCLVGGPPCQAFSVYNHKRGLHDQRSSLFRDYLRIVRGLQPKWVVMENVTGIMSAGGGDAVAEITTKLRSLGYHTEMRVLKAEEYGIPQERRRVLFIGNRLGLPIPWPSPTHGPGLRPYTTVWDAIGDLPVVKNGENPPPGPYGADATNSYQKELRGNQTLVYNHSAPRLGSVNLARLKHIPQGGSWRDIPYELLPEGMKRARRSDHTKRYGRLMPKGLASTILTKCDPHWGAFFHPTQDRALTVREAARLQSFPDTYLFSGSRTDQYVQVGNAVPPILGRTVAKSILSLMSEVEYSSQSMLRSASG